MEIATPELQNYVYLSRHRFSKEVLNHLTFSRAIVCILTISFVWLFLFAITRFYFSNTALHTLHHVSVIEVFGSQFQCLIEKKEYLENLLDMSI